MVFPSTQFLYMDWHCLVGENPEGEQVGEGGVGGDAVGVSVVLSGVVGRDVVTGAQPDKGDRRLTQINVSPNTLLSGHS